MGKIIRLIGHTVHRAEDGLPSEGTEVQTSRNAVLKYMSSLDYPPL